MGEREQMDLGPLVPGRFVRRLNRFAALVEVGGRGALAHLPNSGRLGELLVDGRPVYLRVRRQGGRRCAYDLALVRYRGRLVSIDARLPNRLVAEALGAGRIGPLRGYRRVRAEVRRGNHRLDFVLDGRAGRCLVEAKSCTLVEGGTALFPDAPTQRGREHVELLARAARRGAHACVIFVVQRADPVVFRPFAEADPDLARALVRAARAGVRVLAYRCHVTRRAIALADRIPVELPFSPSASAGRRRAHLAAGPHSSPSPPAGGRGWG